MAKAANTVSSSLSTTRPISPASVLMTGQGRMPDQEFFAASIERLLRPRSVAIVGASATPGALGASVLANLDRAKFQGDIHLINPKRNEIGGRRCLKSPDELP